MTGDDEDKDPLPSLADMVKGAEDLYNLFLAYKAAGFTEAQSMQLICALLQGVHP